MTDFLPALLTVERLPAVPKFSDQRALRRVEVESAYGFPELGKSRSTQARQHELSNAKTEIEYSKKQERVSEKGQRGICGGSVKAKVPALLGWSPLRCCSRDAGGVMQVPLSGVNTSSTL